MLLPHTLKLKKVNQPLIGLIKKWERLSSRDPHWGTIERRGWKAAPTINKPFIFIALGIF